MLKSLILVSLILSNAFGSYVCKKVVGSVSFKGKAVKKGMKLEGAGPLKTGEKSFVSFLNTETGDRFNLAKNSKLNVTETTQKTKKSSPLGLINGAVRIVSGQYSRKKGETIKTKEAALGVRGTDFLTIRTGVLGETEVIIFDGSVEFKSKSDKSDKVLVKKNGWGGIGGRFGTRVKTIPKVPKAFIDSLRATH